MSFSDAQALDHHGFVVEIGPPTNPNYFTGVGYSALLANAKVFRTARGANQAALIWQTADYGKPIPRVWFDERRTRPVALRLQLQEVQS